MKRLLFIFLVLLVPAILSAAPFRFLPHKITQPDGTKIDCFVSGDEFFNWIHDADGYSIIQDEDGYYYYAEKADEQIIASQYRVNSVSPEKTGLKKWVIISRDEYLKKKARFELPVKDEAVKAPHTGTLNNVVIYIRFADEVETGTTRSDYNKKMNNGKDISVKTYYQEVSYQQLTITSTHYPGCTEPTSTNTSYQDSHVRGYFQPHNSTTNPIGYETETVSRQREHQLLVDAIEWVSNNDPIPAELNIDMDDDGYVDNICFMVNGNSDGWSELLWAHRWSLWSLTSYINGKRVYDYTFQPENQVSVKTLCHEMFHALSAPDLYHYDDGDLNLDPVGPWDIMKSGGGHMGAYMKWRYADQNWISEIPEISEPGTYTLNPLTSPVNNCYKILSPNSTKEFFIVEYRQRSGLFESNLPGDGLIVYRINTDFRGNASFNNETVFDEVYVYRPGGEPLENGSINTANFSSDAGRTIINDNTDPNCFLTDNSPGGLNISSVTSAGETISFYIGFETFTISAEADPPEGGTISGDGDYTAGQTVNLVATPSGDYIFIKWTENGNIVASIPNYSFPASENRSLVAHFELPAFTITTLAQPDIAGTITGAGNYTSGETVTLTAFPNIGFEFANWTEDGSVVSTNPTYEFVAVANTTLTGNFETELFDVTANIFPANSGTIEGMGDFEYGDIVALYAVPQTGYDFISWKENGTIVSRLPGITFSVKKDRSFEVNFALSTTVPGIHIKDFEIYPNPSTGLIHLKSNSINENNCIARIYNITGTLLFEKELKTGGVEIFDLKNVAKGMYILVIKGDKIHHTEKVIIR